MKILSAGTLLKTAAYLLLGVGVFSGAKCGYDKVENRLEEKERLVREEFFRKELEFRQEAAGKEAAIRKELGDKELGFRQEMAGKEAELKKLLEAIYKAYEANRVNDRAEVKKLQRELTGVRKELEQLRQQSNSTQLGQSQNISQTNNNKK